MSETQHREIYQKITEKAKNKDEFSTLDLKTILNHLIRLPEVYKLDFLNVLLPEMLNKCNADRDPLLYQHYRHYVSIPCLSALLSTLIKSEEALGEDIVLLIEHIKNLQLQPGPTAKERELLEQMNFDILNLLQKHKVEDNTLRTVDLRNIDQRKRLANLYYDRILKSFISEDEDNLISEDDFINQLRTDILKSEMVQRFASESSSQLGGDKTKYLKSLGLIINSSITSTYLENYKGVFNGDRIYVLERFEEVIENRFLDHEDGGSVDLDKISAGIIALTLELVFNSSITAFRTEINSSIYNSLQKEN